MGHTSPSRRRRRYKLKLVEGALYVNRLHVKAVIDHDAGEVRLSNEVPVVERLDLAAKLMRLAASQAGRGEPFTHVYRNRRHPGDGAAAAAVASGTPRPRRRS